MRKHIYTFILLIIAYTASAQSTYKIIGAITDSKTNKAIELSSIVLYTTDTVFTAGTASDLDGKFELDHIKPGNYLIKISSLGYIHLFKTIQISNTDVNTGNIALSAEEKTLQEVAVTATKKIYTKDAEKATFNVSQSPTHQIGTADNVLQNLPGVTVDQDGNISIQGKQGVIILVDGKTNPMATANLNAFLKSIPANAIESIELITNPSAKYQAEGNAGIINIKLKKGRANGFNASITGSYGTIARTNDNIVVNYRKNKINLFGTYAFSYVKNKTKYIEDRDIYLKDTSYYYMNSPSNDVNQNHTVKGGFDYFINPNNTLTYTGNFNWSGQKSLTNSYSNFKNNLKEIINEYNSTVNNNEKFYTVTNDLSYQKTYDTTERSFSMNLTHTFLKGKERKQLSSLATDNAGNYDPIESLNRNTYIGKNIHNIILQFDYTQPLKAKGQKIETGMRNETTINKNIFDVYTLNNNIEEKDTLLSNNFDYIENINAFYGTWNALFKEQFSVNAGLRLEHTFIKSTNNNVERNYMSLFPSLSFGYYINENHALTLAYARRINRPSFQQINNSIIYFDRYTTWQGNPYLRPAFFDQISLNYEGIVKKHIFNIEVGGYFTKDEYTESSLLDSVTRLSRGSVINGSNGKQAYIEIYTKFVFTKWWDLQTNHNIIYTHYSYLAGYNKAPIQGVSYNLWASNVFRFWKNMSIDINGWFNMGGVSFQGKSKAVGVLNVAVRKSFLKNNSLTVALTGQNLLQSMNWRWYTQNSNMLTNGSWQSFNRTVNLSLTYVFGNKNALRRQDDKSNSRLQGGGGNGK